MKLWRNESLFHYFLLCLVCILIGILTVVWAMALNINPDGTFGYVMASIMTTALAVFGVGAVRCALGKIGVY